MSPRRVIDGDVIHDPDFAGMSWVAQLLWYRLWDVADSWGYGVWDPVVLKVNCFPLNKNVGDSKVKGAMDEIADRCQGIGFCEVKKQRFFFLVDWEKVVNPKHRKESWIQKLLKSEGQQMKLLTQRQSTEIRQKPVPGIGIGIGIDIGTGAESPSGKKEVEGLRKITAKELADQLKADMQLSYSVLRQQSAERQARVEAEKKRIGQGGAEESVRERLTDEQICQQLKWTPEELAEKRKKGIFEWSGVRL